MNEPTSFGAWIKRRRRALDLTQKDLAERVSCSPVTIAKIETDERRPSRQLTDLLARHLQIPEDQRGDFMRVARGERVFDRFPSFTEATVGEITVSTDAIPYPPPPSAGTPAPSTPLIGRTVELAEISRLFERSECRLLCLTGPGGVGKTRLAIEIANRHRDQFPDGVYYCSLESLTSSEYLLPTIAVAVGMPALSTSDPKVQLLNFLHKKNLLLVLDNLEHISQDRVDESDVDGIEIIPELLMYAPNLMIMATSRQRLHLSGEWVYELYGLSTPPAREHGHETDYSAVTLFLNYARQAGVDLSLQGSDLVSVAQICRLLEGSPLGISLAAPWVRMLSPREIATEIEHNLDFLATTARDVPSRQRSLRAAFDHSWRLLTEEERSGLMRLSVFTGGFTREAARLVAGAELTLLSAIIDKSLLRREPSNRFQMHELVRQYAAERLQAHTAIEQTTHQEHCRYYADLLVNCESPMRSSKQYAVLTEISTEMDNIRQAWHWAANRRQLLLLGAMIPSLMWFYEVRNFFHEGATAMQYAIERIQRAGAPSSLYTPTEQTAYAFLLSQSGWFIARIGQIEEALALYNASQALAGPHNDHHVLYYIHAQRSYWEYSLGLLDKAEASNQKAMQHAQEMASTWHTSHVYTNMAMFQLARGQAQEAYGSMKQALALAEKHGDPRVLIFEYMEISLAALALGRTEEAVTYARRAVGISENLTDRWGLAMTLNLMGRAYLAQGTPQQAISLFKRAGTLTSELSDLWGLAQSQVLLGTAHLALGELEAAEQAFRQSLKPALDAQVIPNGLEAFLGIAEVYRRRGNFVGAYELAAFTAHNPLATLETHAQAVELEQQLAEQLPADQSDKARSMLQELSFAELALRLLSS